MDALIGYTGFVGSHILREGMDVYNSSNISDIRGRSYHTVYCAGVYAEKWKANKDPETDRKQILALMEQLQSVCCERFVLLSTVDVYNASFPQCEEADICLNVYATHAYGKHRLEMESWAQKTFPSVFVFRLPALFGPGLKKNALYDLIHNNQVEKLRSHWSFQWYDIRWIWNDMNQHMERNHRVVNLVTPPMTLELIRTLFFPTTILSSEKDTLASYRISSKYGFTHTTEDVLFAMSDFLTTPPSRYLVSELAWSPSESAKFRSFLRSKGILEEEIVPSKRNWDIQEYTHAYSAQSLLYGVDIQIFQEPERFLDILRKRLSILQKAGVRVVVFGSPKQRIYSGEDAVGLFRQVGDLCIDFGIDFCVENNARQYGGNWLNTLQGTVEFVETVNHPRIFVNLDIGSMIMENELRVTPSSRIRHVQVSFPHLGKYDTSYTQFARSILAQLPEYTGKISLEMTVPSLRSIELFLSELSPFQRSP